MHIEIENYHLASLLFGLAECRLDTIFALNTFSIAKFTIYSVFRILMTYNNKMFIDTDIHILKRIEQDSRYPNVVGEFCLVSHLADEQTFTIYVIYSIIAI